MQSQRRGLVRPSGKLVKTKETHILHRNRVTGKWSVWKNRGWVDMLAEDVKKLVHSP